LLPASQATFPPTTDRNRPGATGQSQASFRVLFQNPVRYLHVAHCPEPCSDKSARGKDTP